MVPGSTRRVTLAAGLAALAGGKAAAQAVTRVARVFVGFPPGGPQDIVARLYAEKLRNRYAPQAIVENRSGAGGRLAVEAVKVAPPDGTALLFGAASLLTIYPHIYARTLRYDALVDFVPVTPACVFPFALAVRADHPARTLAAFADWARARGPTTFASPAAGSMPHFLGIQTAKALNIELTHVPYRGTAPAVQDLFGGQITAVVVPLAALSEPHRTGGLRVLAVSSPERMPTVPDVPSFAEQGYPGLTAEEWIGALLPAQTPAPIVAELHAAIVAAAAEPDLQDALTRIDYRPLTSTPAEFAERIRTEREHWGNVIRDADFRAEE